VNLKELGFNPENGDYVFYFSAISGKLDNGDIYFVDAEPDHPSGDWKESLNYHKRIVRSTFEKTPTETTQSPTSTESTQSPTTTTPTKTITPTTSPSLTTEEVTSPTTLKTIFDEWLGPILIVIGLVVGALIFIYGRRKSRIESKQEETSTESVLKPEDKEYCFHCGAAMPVGSSFCKKCGKT